MKALVAGEAKLKLALPRAACGLGERGVAQTNEAVRQQGRDLGSALPGCHSLGWDMVGWVHRLSLLDVKLARWRDCPVGASPWP
ncbi:hypothetical protein [Methylococcus capsulatus]|uniref:hypothetical protein n=1 Tax=Methylococcus capsulatus TaxID=414 RepID=UPI001C5317E6|nr:hypothetical protein [Methylococcus capsulatus]QXP89204.1 hypothetical protein KW114_08650 [Methylococcus capsulatus]